MTNRRIQRLGSAARSIFISWEFVVIGVGLYIYFCRRDWGNDLNFLNMLDLDTFRWITTLFVGGFAYTIYKWEELVRPAKEKQGVLVKWSGYDSFIGTAYVGLSFAVLFMLIPIVVALFPHLIKTRGAFIGYIMSALGMFITVSSQFMAYMSIRRVLDKAVCE